MDFNLTDEQTLLQQTVRQFAEAEMAPDAIERDETKTWPEDIVRQLGEMGLMGIMVPEQYGGAGMDAIAYTIAMEIKAARLLVRRAAFAKDQGEPFSHLAAMAKVFASEAALRAATQCVQIHGGYGYIRETGVERLMRDAKITQIYGGT